MASAVAAAEHGLAVLHVDHLQKSFELAHVLKAISFEMAEGDFLVLTGPAGSGKSVLLNCIAGLDDVDGGTISVAGRDVTNLPSSDRDVAMIFKSHALYPSMSVSKNISFGMKMRGLPKAEQIERTDAVARLLQIEEILSLKPAQLTGSQSLRVAVARALVRDPMLFLFDDPMSGLDRRDQLEMRDEIKNLHERMGASMVYVTHDPVEAMSLATRLVVIHDGTVQQVGTPDDIYERPANIFVAKFTGSPLMNLIDARFTSADSDLRIQLSERENGPSFVDRDPPDALRAFVDQPIIVGLRPETVQLNLTTNADFTAPITLTEKSGPDTYAHLSLGTKEIIVRLPGRTRPETGRPLGFSVDCKAVSYFDPGTGLRIS